MSKIFANDFEYLSLLDNSQLRFSDFRCIIVSTVVFILFVFGIVGALRGVNKNEIIQANRTNFKETEINNVFQNNQTDLVGTGTLISGNNKTRMKLVNISLSRPFLTQFVSELVPGTEILVAGTHPLKVDSNFDLYLLESLPSWNSSNLNETDDIPLHIQMRMQMNGGTIKQDVITRSRVGGEWVSTLEQVDNLSIKSNQFTIKIICEKDKFIVKANNHTGFSQFNLSVENTFYLYILENSHVHADIFVTYPN